jgi:hypothetical protein
VALLKDEERATYACITILLIISHIAKAASALAAGHSDALSARGLRRDGSASQPNQHTHRYERKYAAHDL